MPQVDAVYVDTWIFPILRGAVPPILNMDAGFLVHLTDGGWGHLAAQRGLGNVPYPAHRNTGKVHLNEGFLDAALTAAVPLNNGGLEEHALGLRHMEHNIAHRRRSW